MLKISLFDEELGKQEKRLMKTVWLESTQVNQSLIKWVQNLKWKIQCRNVQNEIEVSYVKDFRLAAGPNYWSAVSGWQILLLVTNGWGNACVGGFYIEIQCNLSSSNFKEERQKFELETFSNYRKLAFLQKFGSNINWKRNLQTNSNS